ncbi:hypothetical protein PCANC_14178 [Puccinia coronata f. sp. avenae]|uniref:ENTH domain-containing protein n=1 Tax=Puccinia coronata f. sp. avenae TaxID=200324 RepID=A0A2N5UK23_9BASI|nr:hypothetical protein PCANC_14178 [Puccinia coronata f. sp. avenae]PLW46614.1 hypothetical protein PCASD_07396 [Puccinia coronata f. sp. avenae]
MSGHWFKIVSGACKAKHAPPKSKYIDALVASTYQADGSFQDVSRALRSKLRDPNSSVVFKALLVIHTLIRAGNAEEVMKYWSGVDGRDGRSLGLKDVVDTTDTPQNLSRYANYLLARFKCYAALKHDPIRTRSEAPASLRNASRNGANRLRSLTVEKGLLREVGTLQKLMDALVDCKFYLEDTDDDLVMSALRLLVKDLLVLFQAVNEGVINVLEHYFEMSHVDATTALKTYKIFCKQCERVVSYLGVAKKLQRIINVNIPNLRHAPVSLSGSLEEYLNDPNFETNRQEYKESKRVADGRPTPNAPTPKPKENETTKPKDTSNQPAPQPAESQKAFIDFFESIESEQQSMFNPTSLSPTSSYFQQQAGLNPFGQPNTGFPPNNTMFPQPTGMMSHATGRESMGQALFGSLNGSQPPQFIASQPTGFSPGGQLPNLVQPQMTGAMNPFRQSTFSTHSLGGMGMMPSQPTGANPFSQFGSNPTISLSTIPSSPWSHLSSQPDRSNGAMSAPPIQTGGGMTNFDVLSPLGSTTSATSSQSNVVANPLKAQVTGSRNPFALLPGSTSTPPVPPLPGGGGAPSLNALAASAFSQSMVQQRAREQAAQLQFQQQQQKQQEQQQTNPSAHSIEGPDHHATQKRLEEEARKKEFQEFFGKQLSKLEGGGRDLQKATATGTGGLFSTVASEFAVTKPTPAGGEESHRTGMGGGGGGGGGLVSQPTGFGGSLFDPQPASQPSQQQPMIMPQRTGFGGSSIKPFQPSSSFGASLAAQLEKRPEIQSNPFGTLPPTLSQPSSTFLNTNTNHIHHHQDLMGFDASSTSPPAQPSHTQACIPNQTPGLI